jgi:hypothetical protein
MHGVLFDTPGEPVEVLRFAEGAAPSAESRD